MSRPTKIFLVVRDGDMRKSWYSISGNASTCQSWPRGGNGIVPQEISVKVIWSSLSMNIPRVGNGHWRAWSVYFTVMAVLLDPWKSKQNEGPTLGRSPKSAYSKKCPKFERSSDTGGEDFNEREPNRARLYFAPYLMLNNSVSGGTWEPW